MTLHRLALARALGIALTAMPAAAQNTPALRDPMVPRLAIARPSVQAGAAGAVPTPPTTSQQLLTVNDRRHGGDGRRRLGVGNSLGGARIERITDSAVWVRDGNTVTRLTFYGGVVKHHASASPPSTPTIRSIPKTLDAAQLRSGPPEERPR